MRKLPIFSPWWSILLQVNINTYEKTIWMFTVSVYPKDSYIRMMLIELNTIICQQLILKLDQLGLNTSLCNCWTCWPRDNRWVGRNTSQTEQEDPARMLAEALLFTLLPHKCTLTHSSHLFIPLMDDVTVTGLLCNDDETTTGALSATCPQ